MQRELVKTSQRMQADFKLKASQLGTMRNGSGGDTDDSDGSQSGSDKEEDDNDKEDDSDSNDSDDSDSDDSGSQDSDSDRETEPLAMPKPWKSGKAPTCKLNVKDTGMVTVIMDLEHNTLPHPNRRVCSLAATVFDHTGTPIKWGNKQYFHHKVKIDRPMGYQGIKCHGMTTKSLEKEKNFASVGELFWAHINACRGTKKKILLVAHNGFACDFRLLLLDMERYGVSLPENVELFMCDTLSVMRGEKDHFDYDKASVDDWPQRTTKNKPSLKLECVCDYILKKNGSGDRLNYLNCSPTATSQTYCGSAHNALADVKALAVIYFDPMGVTKRLNLKKFHGKEALASLKAYTAAVVAYEKKMEDDEVLGEWTEQQPTSFDPDPEFAPNTNEPATGGPSAALRAWVGDVGGQSWDEVALKVMRYYLNDDVLQIMVDSTMSKASTMGVWENGRWRRLKASDEYTGSAGDSSDDDSSDDDSSDDDSSDGERPNFRVLCPLLVNDPLTLGEMFAMLGSFIFRGTCPRRKQTQYWDTQFGFGDDRIRNTFLQKRYLKVVAQWSFEIQGGGEPGALQKFDRFDKKVQERIRSAWCIEPKGGVDESRVKSYSKYCPFNWTMHCKPIKHGMTLYSLVFESGYVYSWLWWTGKDGQTRTHGQPSEQTAVNPNSSEHTFIVRMLQTLVGAEFHDTFFRFSIDKAFMTLKVNGIFDALGILTYGMTKARAHPKSAKMTRPATTYWPFGLPYTKAGGYEQRHERGWRRVAYHKLPSGRLQAAGVWLDSRFVTYVANCYLDDGDTPLTVRRYDRNTKTYVTREATNVIVKYNADMGFVDLFNRDNAESGCQLKRVQNRYHRRLGSQVLDHMRHNVFVAVEWLIGKENWKEVEKKRRWFSFRDYKHVTLSVRMMREGARMAKEEMETEHGDNYDPNNKEHVPVFIPTSNGVRRSRMNRPHTIVHAFPHEHTFEATSGRIKNGSGGWVKRGRCVSCYAFKNKAGGVHSTHRIQQPCIQQQRVNYARGCTECKKILCKACHNDSTKFNHVTGLVV